MTNGISPRDKLMISAARPGWKTTEFWLSLLSVLLGALMSSGLLSDGSVAMRVAGVVATVLGALGYSVSRGIAKGGASAPPDLDRGPRSG